MASKEQKLWDSVKDMAAWTGREALMLQAICKLLSYNNKATRQKPAEPPDNRAKLVQARLQLECPSLNVSTYTSGDIGKLTRVLQGIHDFQDSDVDTLIAWVNDGHLDYWDVPPTFQQLVKHFSNWLAQAREWGRPTEEHRGSAIR